MSLKSNCAAQPSPPGPVTNLVRYYAPLPKTRQVHVIPVSTALFRRGYVHGTTPYLVPNAFLLHFGVLKTGGRVLCIWLYVNSSACKCLVLDPRPGAVASDGAHPGERRAPQKRRTEAPATTARAVGGRPHALHRRVGLAPLCLLHPPSLLTGSLSCHDGLQ